jgi:Putative prokaryotic signal transducing protein
VNSINLRRVAEERSSREASGVGDYVTIETVPNEAIAEMVRQRLDESGIPCVLVPSNLAAVAGSGASYSITVPAERAGEARELLGD